MTWYEVPVRVWLEAPDESTATDTVLDKLDGTMRHGGPAEEMTPEQMQPLHPAGRGSASRAEIREEHQRVGQWKRHLTPSTARQPPG